MSDKGFIKLDRQIAENWLWNKKPFSEGQAWIDLILLADYKDHKNPYKGEIVTYKRGTVNLSISALAIRWGWGRDRARRFLHLLESDGMLHLNATTNRTTITLVNYGKYQDVPTVNKATNRQRAMQRVDNEQYTPKEYKERKEYKENICEKTYEELNAELGDDW